LDINDQLLNNKNALLLGAVKQVYTITEKKGTQPVKEND